VLKSRDPISKLRPKEMAVLSELLFQYNFKLKSMDVDDRYDLMFTTRKRKEMRDLIGISEESFNNNLSILRRYGLITKDNRLNKSLESLDFKNEFSLEFFFREGKNE
jgi:hypothetical protein